MAGFVAAINAKSVCHPIDTVKTLSQVAKLESSIQNTSHSHNNNNNNKVTPFRVFRQAISEGGILRLYRGITPSMIGAWIGNSIQFWLFGAAERELQSILNKTELSIIKLGYCGAITGCGLSLWLTPTEFIKCQMQVTETSLQYNNSPFKCLYDNLLHKPSNLFIGLDACLIREILRTFTYFVSYRGSI